MEAAEGGRVRLVNNILVGKGSVLVGPGSLDANVIRGNAGLLDRTRFDYQLRDGSPAIDGGIDAVDLGEIAFPPAFEYRRPQRRAQGRVDAGAHEYHAADGGN